LASGLNPEERLQEATPQDGRSLFLFKGFIDNKDTVSVFYSARTDDLELELTPPISTGAYALVFLDDNGNELGRHPFEPDFSDSDVGELSATSLLFVVPLPDDASSFRIQRGDKFLLEHAFGTALPVMGSVIATPDNDGKVLVRWTASDPDSADLAYSVHLDLGPDRPPMMLTSGLKGTSYVFDPAFAPATNSARFIIEASDGYHTATAESNVFTINEKAPIASIIEPTGANTIVAGQPVNLTGAGYDYSRGLLPDESLTWTSSLDGTIAEGAKSKAILSAGTHTITLQVASDSGLVNETSIEISVQDDSDGDGLPDEYEVMYPCLSPTVFDSDIDVDMDSLLPLGERGWGTDPCHADTDGDGVNDGEEVRLGSDPLDNESTPLPDLLSVSPTKVDLGNCPDPISASVMVQAAPNLNWSATANADWLTTSDGGTGDGVITITAQCSELGEGEYTGQLLISATGVQPHIVEVSLNDLDGSASVIYLPVISDK
jgi:hypothetical protein